MNTISRIKATRATRTLAILGGLLALAGATPRSAPPHLPPAQTTPDALQRFGTHMIGAWEADGSRHVFEWGVGGVAIHTKSYFGEPGAWTLVSEGLWYADPNSDAIRGITVAIDMPVSLFEYTSRVEGDEVVHDLVAHGESSGRYVETWSVEGDEYSWTLLETSGPEPRRVMGGSYRRAGS